jgi:hypothetical protein
MKEKVHNERSYLLRDDRGAKKSEFGAIDHGFPSCATDQSIFFPVYPREKRNKMMIFSFFQCGFQCVAGLNSWKFDNNLTRASVFTGNV